MKKERIGRRLLPAALCLLLLLTAGCGRYVSLLPGTEAGAAEVTETPEAQPGVFAARPLLTLLGWEDLRESYYADTPVALGYRPTDETGAAGCRAWLFDRASIIAACDALRGMDAVRVCDETPVTLTEYTLTMADGRGYAVTFGLLADGETRVVSDGGAWIVIQGGDALWELLFPAYSQTFDIFDLYFDESVRAFADEFSVNTPDSVGYRLGSGAGVTSTDPDTVRAVFDALAGAQVLVVEDEPDLNIDLTRTRDYFFTFSDGGRVTFSFADRCLAVTASAAFGPVYYWITGTDTLWGVEISSRTGEAAFAGGTAADLREDIARAAAAAAGTSEEGLTVLGVFVEYSIGGESGYIALEGQKATEFLTQICALPVSAETVEAPEGDTFTLSVTLSDNTGPILYFTGDTLQQVVGTNYACDGTVMQALRDRVLALAATGENTAQVEEGGTE